MKGLKSLNDYQNHRKAQNNSVVLLGQLLVTFKWYIVGEKHIKLWKMSPTGDYYSKHASNTVLVLPIWGLLYIIYGQLHTRLNTVVRIKEILSYVTMWSPCSQPWVVALVFNYLAHDPKSMNESTTYHSRGTGLPYLFRNAPRFILWCLCITVQL